MSLTPRQYLEAVKKLFHEAGQPEVAEGQARYMRNQFEFYGLKMPAWTALAKDFFKANGLFDGAELKTFARLCFEDDYREIQYLGLEMVQRRLKKQEEDFIYFLEELIQSKSWWDTVDWLNKLTGIHFKRFPHLIKPVTEKWIASGNIWLQRVCLIFQLTYKQDTNQDLLFDYVLRLAHSDEFFIQKAAGWALRQYSRYEPEAVTTFINSHQLAPLTKREGLKIIRKNSKT